MRFIPPLRIAASFDHDIDLTDTWAGRIHPDIFPAIYRRYRAPLNVEEARRQIDDLGAAIEELNRRFELEKTSANSLGLRSKSNPIWKSIKELRTLRNRYEAARRAYLHWLALENGDPELLPVLGVTQYSGKTRLDLLVQAVITLVNLYASDLNDERSSMELAQKLESLKQHLQAVFTTCSRDALGNHAKDPIA